MGFGEHWFDKHLTLFPHGSTIHCLTIPKLNSHKEISHARLFIPR
jgi:hypothetical protein